MAKFKAPKNFGGITHGGETYKASKGSVITLPDDFPADVAAAHGIVPADDAPADEPAADGDAGGAAAGEGTGA
ncbi:hypothetical protein WJ94_16045 [Burkholderia ubonensis]|uniref:hypothetical protein n=1 Tax=Burkholderia ubonensis TaxID=101571 RepID=UPI00075DF0AF|nr:hypothetical protein [Burkholderia ubonensis]KVP76920.1 hypothetical protein WJ94_16045 [Burkholderia ubonensis]KVQ87348.1 hypothetical protein WK09_20135 [Burkholderia ubonensis]KWB89934.1 hypothetical protein WL43_07500 [Burkholderia ubonensis]